MSNACEVVREEVRIADWARHTKRSALQEMLALAARPGNLSFALGVPAPEFFPAEAFARAAAGVLRANPLALQYNPPAPRLKEQVVELMARRGVACRPEQVFLTAGAQQGLSLLTHLFLNPGGQVLVERLTYTGLRQALEPFQPEVLTVPTCADEGMDVEAVEAVLAGGARPAFIYTVADGHNPLGISLSAEKRARLVELARHYRVPVIEDDPYGFLCYDGVPLPPLRAADDEFVFYVGSFSKILSPSLRLGWVIAPCALMHQLSVIKEASDINTATFSQHLVSAYLDENRIADQISLLCREYRARRDALEGALAEHFPRGTTWRSPRCGVFVWVRLPPGGDAERLLKTSLEVERISFVPGSAFSPGADASHCLRLNFSNPSPDQIRDGIRRLATLL